MAEYINQQLWNENLARPDWYLAIKDDFKRLSEVAERASNPEVRSQIKHEIYDSIELALQEKRIPLATAGDNLDSERQPIDRIVVHHTKNKPGMTLEQLNAMHLLRIYGMYYANPTDPREKHFKGQPVWSGHFYKSKQVFWGYHWLLRADGTAEQILDDNYIGWHAGNWDINTRSIGICIDDDLSHNAPTKAALSGLANIIRSQYPHITAKGVIGHCEANATTVCPGDQFASNWKNKLLQLLDQAI